MLDYSKVPIEHGNETITLTLRPGTDVLRSAEIGPLFAPGRAIKNAIAAPIDGPGLAVLAKGKSSACVVVSDSTRPVPYRGEASILLPVIEVLRRSGLADITVLVGCGTHRPMEREELEAMLDPEIFGGGVRVINHVSTDPNSLELIGSTPNTPRVQVNRHYLAAELKILTGLVEPHFMAGWSGGRKAVCPGICGQEVTYGFHSARMLSDPGSRSLLLDGNPCHEESLSIARMAGADFTINVTLDANRTVTGVFCGGLEAAHKEACSFCATYTSIPIEELYDIVVIPAGYVGVNHYQAGKAAVEGAKAVRPGGRIIIPARLGDPDPIGGENYRRLLRDMTAMGSGAFLEAIQSDSWSFVPEQWQVQMYAGVYEHLSAPRNLYLCSPRLQGYGPRDIPDSNPAAGLDRSEGESDTAWTQRMVQATLDRLADERPKDRVLVLPDGPYAVPVLRS